MAGILIPDGYTEDGKIEAAGRWPALAFRYRMAVNEEMPEYQHACRASGKSEAAARVKLICDHVESWDASLIGKDETLAVTPDNVRRLPDALFNRLVDFIGGYNAKAVEAAKNSPAA